jgi:feruloyl esterase
MSGYDYVAGEKAGQGKRSAGLVASLLTTMLMLSVDSIAGPSCMQLQRLSFLDTVDAPTRVASAKLVASNTGVPEHCQVDAEVTPNVGIAVRLPTRGWNGKFIQVGCGGWCGSTDASAECADPLRRGYVCASTDTGHRGASYEAAWAHDNLRAEIDFAFRANHVTAVAAKAIAERHYGRAPAKSYFLGCSTGGQHGLALAQRYPFDFDGIIAGHPTTNMAEFAMSLLWNYRALFGDDQRPLLSQADLQLLHDAAIERCDLDDGIADGVIGYPPSCKFDPSELLCPGRRAHCLSQVQVDAVKKVYQGPVTGDAGSPLAPGMPYGSELDWIAVYVARYGAVMTGMMEGYFQHMAFVPDPAPGWKSSLFDFNRDPPRLATMSALYSADNPDLRRFKARGAKLIAYQGWADGLQIPQIVDYYETVQRLNGRGSTQDFFRLFMLPGVHHCGANPVDFLSDLEAWVERGVAPDLPNVPRF